MTVTFCLRRTVLRLRLAPQAGSRSAVARFVTCSLPGNATLSKPLIGPAATAFGTVTR